jgi:Glycosyltransferase family 87
VQMDHPLERVARWRYVVIATVALTAGIVSGGRGDWDQFVEAGRAMFGSAGLHVYVIRRDVQTGPLSLTIAWLFAHTPRNGFVLEAVASAALGLLVIRLQELTARPARRIVQFEVLVLTGGILTAFTWAKLGGYGHLDDAITLAAAVVALYEVRAGRPMTAAIAIGIGIAVKPWGVIFLPLTLAADPRRGNRRDWRAPVVACGVAGLAWLPFIIGAPDSLKALRPTVALASDSVLALFGLTDESMPDWLRVAQLLGCLVVATALVLTNRPESVIAGALAVRIATDPATWSYYTPGLVAAILLWDLLDRRQFPWATLITVVALAPTWLVPADTARSVLRLGVTIGVVVWAFRRPPASPASAN